MSIHLETDRLVLREFTEADVDVLLELDRDPEVMRFISDGRPSTIDECRGSVSRILHAYAEHPGLGYWIAELKPSDGAIGWFHLRPDRFQPKDAEIGYRLCRAAWGKGLATEGSEALMSKANRELGLSDFSGRAMALNVVSIRVLEKVGLSFEAEYLEDRFPGVDKRAFLHRGHR